MGNGWHVYDTFLAHSYIIITHKSLVSMFFSHLALSLHRPQPRLLNDPNRLDL